MREVVRSCNVAVGPAYCDMTGVDLSWFKCLTILRRESPDPTEFASSSCDESLLTEALVGNAASFVFIHVCLTLYCWLGLNSSKSLRFSCNFTFCYVGILIFYYDTSLYAALADPYMDFCVSPLCFACVLLVSDWRSWPPPPPPPSRLSLIRPVFGAGLIWNPPRPFCYSCCCCWCVTDWWRTLLRLTSLIWLESRLSDSLILTSFLAPRTIDTALFLLKSRLKCSC